MSLGVIGWRWVLRRLRVHSRRRVRSIQDPSIVAAIRDRGDVHPCTAAQQSWDDADLGLSRNTCSMRLRTSGANTLPAWAALAMAPTC